MSKLHQTSSVAAYQTSFEVIANRTSGLPDSFFVSCFVFGLRPEIQREVLALQPSALAAAIGLARLQEDRLADAQRNAFRPNLPNPSLLPTPSTSLPIRRLTPVEMQSWKDRGLCYNCDERFTPGHRCQSQQFLLLLADDAADYHILVPQSPEPVQPDSGPNV